MRSILIVFTVLIVSNLFCQQDIQKLSRITLVDGLELVGTVVSEDSLRLFFKTKSGIDIIIPKTHVKSIEILSGEIVDEGFIPSDPNKVRLLFSPTAIALKSGQGYFSAY